MTHADLTVAQWRDRTDESARRIAQSIADRCGLKLVQVYPREYAGRSHRVALFEREGQRFALVPGARVQLGYDGGRFAPSPGQAAGYAESADEYGLPELAEFLSGMMSPVRTVHLPAMLVAVEAMDAGVSFLSPDDPHVQELLAEAGVRRGGGTMSMRRSGGVRIEFDEGGQVRSARLVRQVSYDDALREAADLGLRPATPDEWEYACGAGATTLFRWGDDSRDDGYPYDHPVGPHRDANLWGLAIGQDPYRHEWTSERTIVCGGDGGGATCGGSGFFLGWLTLATAYRDTNFGLWLNSKDRYVDRLLLRPVIDLT
ncbi:hypothetical protein [Micromonospora sp. NPDC001898]|uniref:hypothetical protein n=1 Tax=Micromonospora sp. NPDC001898 TaxID=3364221 RepID=UPI0036741354